MSTDVSLTAREQAVLVEIFKRIPMPTFKNEEWQEIADAAGITDGNVARNAKYSFANAKKKLGIAAEPATPVKTPSKRETDNAGDEAAEQTPSKKPKQKGGKKKVVVKEEGLEETEE